MTQPKRRLLLLAAFASAIAGLRRMGLSPVRVEGDSMEPTLPAGSLLAVSLVRKAPGYGVVVVVRRPDGSEHVKRIVGRSGDSFEKVDGLMERVAPGMFAVAGDNRARSTDSRDYGPVRESEIVAVVRLCYWPPSAWRMFPST